MKFIIEWLKELEWIGPFNGLGGSWAKAIGLTCSTGLIFIGLWFILPKNFNLLSPPIALTWHAFWIRKVEGGMNETEGA